MSASSAIGIVCFATSAIVSLGEEGQRSYWFAQQTVGDA